MSDLRHLPTDLRDHLGELTGNEYKVWTAYYLRTGDFDLTAHPSNQTIEQDTGLSNRTVKTSKAELISKGWLGYTGDYKQPRHAEGTYAVPVMEVRLPWRPGLPVGRDRHRCGAYRAHRCRRSTPDTLSGRTEVGHFCHSDA